jgi:hypothetical protein
LGSYAKRGAFTDCYSTPVAKQIELAEFVEAFYTTPLFKLERWILARALGIASTDQDAKALACGARSTFSAWKVEERSSSEILMDAGQTRSWLSVVPTASSQSGTTLLFGSAVVPMRAGGKFGFAFYALLGFHRLYSKLLLSAAARRVQAHSSGNGVA